MVSVAENVVANAADMTTTKVDVVVAMVTKKVVAAVVVIATKQYCIV